MCKQGNVPVTCSHLPGRFGSEDDFKVQTLHYGSRADPTRVSPMDFDPSVALDVPLLLTDDAFDTQSNSSGDKFGKEHLNGFESNARNADNNNPLLSTHRQSEQNVGLSSTFPDSVCPTLSMTSKKRHGIGRFGKNHVSYHNPHPSYTIKVSRHVPTKSNIKSRHKPRFRSIYSVGRKILKAGSRSRPERANLGMYDESDSFPIYIDLDGEVSVLRQRFSDFD
jgi:hypothetical protein